MASRIQMISLASTAVRNVGEAKIPSTADGPAVLRDLRAVAWLAIVETNLTRHD